MFDWREAHHWLRGFSDASLCKDMIPQDEKYRAAYERGWNLGRRRCLV